MTEGKPWPEMNREERLAAMDVIEEEMRTMAAALEKDFTGLFEQAKAPIRVEVDIRLVITDNRQDPRLP